MKNLEAFKYYRITEESYKALDSIETPFMNLGFWPAANIRDAQENLVNIVLNQLPSGHVDRILELGPGWGGSRKIINQKFSYANYIGVNCSAEQISYAKELNRLIPKTNYLEGYFEELPTLGLPLCDTLLAIESILHVEDKKKVLINCKELGISQFSIGEICIEEASIVTKFPLFNPSLKYTWSSDEYNEFFSSDLFMDVQILDVTRQVFGGWSEALNQIEESGFKGNARVLKQFRESYLELKKLSDVGLAKYLIISGHMGVSNDR